MFRIIKAIGKDGSDKLDRIKEIHNLEGDLDLYGIGRPAYFIYNDNSGKMMATSAVKDIIIDNNIYKVTTRNSEYWFEEIL